MALETIRIHAIFLSVHARCATFSAVGVLCGDAELGGVVDEVEGVVFGEAGDGGLAAGGELVGEVLGVLEPET